MPTFLSVPEITAASVPGRAQRANSVGSVGSGYSADISVPESAYQATFNQRSASIAKASSDNSDMSKRNQIVRGIRVKPNTYATLDALASNSQQGGTKFADFILQGASEASEEKYQLVETFGEPIVFLFGSRPAIYQYSGVLINTQDYSWRDGWKDKYAQELRGTQLAKNKRRAYLTYDYVLREGYLLGMNIGQIAANPNHVDFSFTMYITREVNLRPTKQIANERAAAVAEAASNLTAALGVSAAAQVTADLRTRVQQALVDRLSAPALSTTAIKGLGVDASGLGGGLA